jgi:hypothetical protein
VTTTQLSALFRDSQERHAALWSSPDLASRPTLELSGRMTRSLGRCYPARDLIRFNGRLGDAQDSSR